MFGKKKSKKRFGSERIDLYQKAVGVKEFREMISMGVYPLVVVFSDEEYKEIYQGMLGQDEYDGECFSSKLYDNYYHALMPDGECKVNYMFLDAMQLQRKFINNEIYLDRFIDIYGKKDIVTDLYFGYDNIDVSIGIGYTDEKYGLFSIAKPDVYKLYNLCRRAVAEYEAKMDESFVLGSEDTYDEKIIDIGIIHEIIGDSLDSLSLCDDESDKVSRSTSSISSYGDQDDVQTAAIRNLERVLSLDHGNIISFEQDGQATLDANNADRPKKRVIARVRKK